MMTRADDGDDGRGVPDFLGLEVRSCRDAKMVWLAAKQVMMMIMSCFFQVAFEVGTTDDLVFYFQFYFHHEKKECDELQMMMHVKKIVVVGDDVAGLVGGMIFCYRRSVHDILVESLMKLHFHLVIVDRDCDLQMCRVVPSRRGKKISCHYPLSSSS